MSPFAAIVFDRDSHSYTLRGVALVSVTTVIGELKPPFDRDRVSQRVAERDGLTVDEVLAEWEAKSLAALAKGSAVHAYIEDLFQGRADTVVESMNDLPELAGFKRAWARLVTSHGARMERQELVVGDAALGVAGCVDALVTLSEGGVRRWHCFDWKTGKKFDAHNRFENLLPPFQDLDASHLTMYSLQTSLYRLILERAAPTLTFGDSYLTHLRSDGSHAVYRGRDYRERLRRWLESRRTVTNATSIV